MVIVEMTGNHKFDYSDGSDHQNDSLDDEN